MGGGTDIKNRGNRMLPTSHCSSIRILQYYFDYVVPTKYQSDWYKRASISTCVVDCWFTYDYCMMHTPYCIMHTAVLVSKRHWVSTQIIHLPTDRRTINALRLCDFATYYWKLVLGSTSNIKLTIYIRYLVVCFWHSIFHYKQMI